MLQQTTTADANGRATVTLKNDSITDGYRVDRLAARVDNQASTRLVVCNLYDGLISPSPLASTSNGFNDDAIGPYFLGPGKFITVEWLDTVPGATCYATITGNVIPRTMMASGVDGSLIFQRGNAGLDSGGTLPSLGLIANFVPLMMRHGTLITLPITAGSTTYNLVRINPTVAALLHRFVIVPSPSNLPITTITDLTLQWGNTDNVTFDQQTIIDFMFNPFNPAVNPQAQVGRWVSTPFVWGNGAVRTAAMSNIATQTTPVDYIVEVNSASVAEPAVPNIPAVNTAQDTLRLRINSLADPNVRTLRIASFWSVFRYTPATQRLGGGQGSGGFNPAPIG